MDFITGLLPTESNAVILTVVDRSWFSKMVHFIPIPKLPSAKETAKLLVFRLHGLPRDIVSDLGSVGEFCRLLGILVSLSSWFHPPV